MSRYKDIPINSINGKRYYITSYYPPIPLSPNDVYAITDFGDRLDILANQFYGDSSLYWIIAGANPDSIQPDSLSVRGGIQIRIPTNINDIITRYEINNNVGTFLTNTSTDISFTTSVTSGGGGSY